MQLQLERRGVGFQHFRNIWYLRHPLTECGAPAIDDAAHAASVVNEDMSVKAGGWEDRVVDTRRATELTAAIAAAQARRVELAAELTSLDTTIAQLSRELVDLNDIEHSEPVPTIALTPAEKIAIFRRLFRGRADVWPRLWQNTRTGKKGYAPVCGNDWVKPICGKPKVKCGECRSQAFLPVTDTVLQDHLQGRHVAGIYAMLPDETCAFLAADFDDADWQGDVLAFAAAGRKKGIEVAIERSRSGNGAHAWIFFQEPVSAAAARKLGSLLLTDACAGHPKLSLKSYDRLFPSQDVMPKGGFGNLIALPLQHGPRQAGNSVFVDDLLRPHPDQWALLASLKPTTQAQLTELVRVAERNDAILGLPLWPETDHDPEKPWQRPPSGAKPRPIVGTLPAELSVTLAQRCFIPTASLPPALIDRLRRLAAFANPQFHVKQAMRMPTTQTPRIIACGTLDAEFLSLPRASLVAVQQLCSPLGIPVRVTDERQPGEELAVTFLGTLRPAQKTAVDAMLPHDFGILVAPPGSGKTVMGAALIAARQRSTLVLVHTQTLVDQWRARLAVFLGLSPKEIGVIAGGKRKVTGRIDVATLQSLVHGDVVDDIVAAYGHVIVDESHHVSAVSFERVLNAVRAKYVTGLTATPRRRDGLHPIAEMQLGPIRHVLEQTEKAESESVARRLVVRNTGVQPESLPRDASIQEVYASLARDEGRNRLIATEIEAAVALGRRVLVLVERTEHLTWFEEFLTRQGVSVQSLHGKLRAKQRKAAFAAWHDVDGEVGRVLLATGRYVGEGFDDPLLDTLFLTSPLSWRGTLVQYVGRLTRESPGKRDLVVYDYLDAEVAVLRRMFEKRRRGYAAIGFATVANASPEA